MRNQLAVRDLLRRDPALRERYGQLKRSLAAWDLASMDEYVEAKTPLLLEILHASGDFTDDEPQATAAVNRAREGDDQRPTPR